MEKSLKLGDGVPVVVDVLRASSTIITALANNVSIVVPVNSQKEAFALRKEGCLIAGEQGGVKLKGFDIGNSPTELLQTIQETHREKLALKTTNATAYLTSVNEAYIASTLNLETAKKKLKGRRVSLVAIGSSHGVSEDLAVAMSLLGSLNGLKLDSQWVKEEVLKSKAAQHLRKIGYSDDVDFITSKTYNILPKLQHGVIRDETHT